jgi:hypothetical protein
MSNFPEIVISSGSAGLESWVQLLYNLEKPVTIAVIQLKQLYIIVYSAVSHDYYSIISLFKNS